MNVLSDVRQRHIEAYFNAEDDLKNARVAIAPDILAEALAVFHRTVIKASGITQAQYDVLARNFTDAVTAQERRRSTSIPSPVYNGIIIRAAVRAGLVTDLDEAAVGDLSGADVVRIAGEVSGALAKAFELPGE